jgi:hypothetical protein
MFRPAVAIIRFPLTIKMCLHNLREGVLMKRSLCINFLFNLVSSVNCLYITNKRCVLVKWYGNGEFTSWGCMTSCGKVWLIALVLSSLWGESLTLAEFVFSCVCGFLYISGSVFLVFVEILSDELEFYYARVWY